MLFDGQRARSGQRRNGLVLIYAIIIMVAMFAIISLAVDLGRVQVAKTELQRAADAGARYAALGINDGTAITKGIAAAGDNSADGSAVTLQSSDVTVGTWANGTFTSGGFTPNAVRVTARRSTSRGDAVPLMFAAVLGRTTCDVTARSYATATASISVNQNIPATGNPFLSGMPNGSSASNNNPVGIPDYAGTSSTPRNSPTQSTMGISPGQAITFDSISGNAANGPGVIDSGPDGNTGNTGHNATATNPATSSTYTNENGIADARMPINCTCGVFLDDNAPNLSPPPSSNLDFSSSASRDFTSLSPQLKQVFFIGDGLKSDGTHQEFVPPPGATRLFLCTWDYYQWSNNSGARNVVINRPTKVTLVK